MPALISRTKSFESLLFFTCFITIFLVSFNFLCNPIHAQQKSSRNRLTIQSIEEKGVPRSLWKFSPEVKKQISQEFVRKTADRALDLSENLESNQTQISRLMSFWQMAYFHDFYHKLYDQETRRKLGGVMKTIAVQPSFFKSERSLRRLRNQWGTTVDSLGTLNQCPEVCLSVLKRFNSNPNFHKDPSETRFCYLVIYSLTRQLGMTRGKKDRESWKRIFSDPFLAEMEKITWAPSVSKNHTPVITNTIFLLASQVKNLSPELRKFSHTTITEATKKQPKFSECWREAIQRIGDFFGNKLADGTKIDTKTLYDDLKKKYFPNSYTFSLGDGKATIKGQLSRMEAKNLVKRMKIVKKEFFRRVPHSTPVKDDKNENFTLVCYPSKDSYKQWHGRFFGLSTDNGGIYMENVGTLYTYQRSARDSIFTFEELVLHEFVHYLDCRYNIYGGFYEQGSPYVKYNIDWYLEGLAECLVGSVKGQGVLPRKKLVRKVVRNPMTVAKIVSSSYKDSDPFAFYPHSGVFHCFLINNHPDLCKQIFRVIRNNDKASMTAVFENMKKNKEIQKEYESYLKKVEKGLKDGSVKFFEDTP